MTYFIPFGLFVLLLTAWFTPTGLDRSPAIHRYLLALMVGIGSFMAYHHDWWPLALWMLCCANALRFPWPTGQLLKFAMAGVLYTLVRSLPLTAEMVPWVLYVIMTVAIGQGVLYFVHRRWSGNTNHTDMLMVMGLASAWALGSIEHSAWFAAGLLFTIPFVLRPGQAYLWVGVGTIAATAQAYPFAAIGILGGMLALPSLTWRYRFTVDGPDHGRIRIWTILLNIWWSTGWKARLIGLGPDSWRSWADSFSRLEQQKTGTIGGGQFMTHPHNEYVHVLFEHGMIGLLLLLGWIGSLLWHAWFTQPALIIPGLTLCAIAFTCFPWTLPYEVAKPLKLSVEYEPFGCMGMVVITMVVVMLLSI